MGVGPDAHAGAGRLGTSGRWTWLFGAVDSGRVVPWVSVDPVSSPERGGLGSAAECLRGDPSADPTVGPVFFLGSGLGSNTAAMSATAAW